MTDKNNVYIVYVVKNSEDFRYCGFCKYDDAEMYIEKHKNREVKSTAQQRPDFTLENAIFLYDNRLLQCTKTLVAHLINSDINQYHKFFTLSDTARINNEQLDIIVEHEKKRVRDENKKLQQKVDKRNKELEKLINIRL